MGSTCIKDVSQQDAEELIREEVMIGWGTLHNEKIHNLCLHNILLK